MVRSLEAFLEFNPISRPQGRVREKGREGFERGAVRVRVRVQMTIDRPGQPAQPVLPMTQAQTRRGHDPRGLSRIVVWDGRRGQGGTRGDVAG